MLVLVVRKLYSMTLNVLYDSKVMFAAAIWICLLSISQCKVITVNNDGNNSTNCCIQGECSCGSFSDALQHLENHTIINITSQSVPLRGRISIANLNNITIFGNDASIACNNSGIVTIIYCSNVVIKGATWDQCGNTTTIYGIGFGRSSNITIHSSIFQFSGACNAVFMFVVPGYIEIRNSSFLYNHVINPSRCWLYGSLFIYDYSYDIGTYIINIANTTFYHNGVFNNNEYRTQGDSALLLAITGKRNVIVYIENSTISTSGSLGTHFLFGDIDNSVVQLNRVTITNNTQGGCILRLTCTLLSLLISSSTFAYNDYGSLKMNLDAANATVELDRVSIYHNRGIYIEHSLFGNDGADEGVGIFLSVFSVRSFINISSCNIYNNIGGSHSIVYVKVFTVSQEAFIVSSNFTNNVGPALHISLPMINFEGLIIYQDNSAESGAAVYIEDNTQVAVGEESSIIFINNSASLHGGAIYVDLPLNCPHHGVVFTSLPNNSDVLFINNSAGITGNSMYFSIPESCDVIRDYSDSNSIVYIPYKFSYSGSGGAEINTSPYQINLCSSPGCNSDNTNNCFIQHGNMLGQSINFNSTVCDYFNNVAESVQFTMKCLNCNGTYRLHNGRALVREGLSEITVVSIDSDSDVLSNANITIIMSSFLSPEYKRLNATFSLELSSCHSGFSFDTSSQQCTCYSNTNVIQCLEQYTEIKQGYWFGNVIGRRTVSLCPQYYCDFSSRIETRTGHYRLPVNQDDQCSPHRRGPACGECSPGYSLSYDTPNCVSNDKCSAGITVLVVVLTMLYWIAVVVVIFVSMYFINNAPIGYVYGIIYYYSIVDILLGNDLYISDGLFQFISILSSFAKLTPQFLGRLCFVHGLSGIDQQFIRFSHAVAVFLLVAVVVIAAQCSLNISKLVSRCIIRVICLLLLLSYTSLATTSLQLLRPLYYQDVNGVYVYLSPSTKYFNGRHIFYATVALFIEIFIVHGLILFLLFESFLKKNFNFVKVKGYLDQLQACYRDGYHWFAAYYLVCRQVIILIVYINTNYDTALYCLQTFCIITVAIHVWIQPYKSTTLNVIDAMILLTMVLVVNLNAFSFSRSSTTAIVAILMLFPFLFELLAFLRSKLYTFVIEQYQKQKNSYKKMRDTSDDKGGYDA